MFKLKTKISKHGSTYDYCVMFQHRRFFDVSDIDPFTDELQIFSRFGNNVKKVMKSFSYYDNSISNYKNVRVVTKIYVKNTDENSLMLICAFANSIIHKIYKLKAP